MRRDTKKKKKIRDANIDHPFVRNEIEMFESSFAMSDDVGHINKKCQFASHERNEYEHKKINILFYSLLTIGHPHTHRTNQIIKL